jgi:RNA polymerase sigma factor (sigma-70 family)
MVGDLDRAEELVQEALVAALERWPFSGVPDNPGAWLMTTARNRALDALRRDKRTLRVREQLRGEADLAPAAASAEPAEDDAEEESRVRDDPLRLIFTCCHPALQREGQVALTLRMLGGLSTREIAAAFLVSEPTAAQRIVRAKRTIRERRLPYRVPDAAELPRRLPAVLDVIYLVFNEGYTPREGDSNQRGALCEEAVRLATLLVELVQGEPEVLGLSALLELQISRQAARCGADGSPVLLEDQDRSRWDRVRIERARRRLDLARAAGDPGPYQLQAAIAECHALAPGFADTDWRRIATLYAELHRLTGSPVVELNRVVAVGMASGPAAALRLLPPLFEEPRLSGYPWLPATRADFLRREGRLEEAARDYRLALGLTQNRAERAFLEERIAECEREG